MSCDLDVGICLVDKYARLPTRAHPEDACYDVYAHIQTQDYVNPIPYTIFIQPKHREIISLGFYIAIPTGWEMQIRPRSGLAAKHGVTVLNTPGTVDCNYRGVVQVVLQNTSDNIVTVQHGDRIAQIQFARVPTVEFKICASLDELGSTDRGSGGFGSSGK
jgi:dUTP pyrophosphatase